MKLSVVILNYNVRFFLEQCIISVERAIKGLDAEIIVADNDSRDGSCEMVERRFPHVKLIKNTDNLGFSKANNLAVAKAKGEYVCILNPDTAVSEDTFMNCINFAEQTPDLGAIGTYLIDGTGNFLPESKRNLPTPRRSLLKMLGFTKGKSGYYARSITPEARGGVEILVGAFMFMRRSVYNKVGGFDEDYFMYGEDIDLSYKLMKASLTNHYLGDQLVLHYKGESTNKDSAYLNRFYGAMKIFYRKHFKGHVLLNGMVSVGVVFAKSLRKFKESKTSLARLTTKEVLLITQDLKLLKQLANSLELPVKTLSKAKLEDEIFQDTMFVFDVEYISYRQIFSVMKKLKNQGNSFRIKPPKCDFLIGSDRSDQKGVVIPLDLNDS